MKKIIIVTLFTLLATSMISAQKEDKSSFYLGLGYSALLTDHPDNGDLNANYESGSTSLKLGYIFGSGFGFVIGGDIQFNNRVTYSSKIGLVYNFGRFIIYPMGGIVMGEPLWNYGQSSAVYGGIGLEGKVNDDLGIYFEPGMCLWGDFEGKDPSTTVSFSEPVTSTILSLGVTYHF